MLTKGQLKSVVQRYKKRIATDTLLEGIKDAVFLKYVRQYCKGGPLITMHLAAYMLVNRKYPHCKTCNKPFVLTLKDDRTGLREYCSVKCCSNDQEILQRRAKTNLKRYGVKAPAQNDKIKAKQIATCQKKYGGNAATSSELIRKKVKATVISRYGVDNIMKVPSVAQKLKDTFISKYGTTCALQVVDFKNKARETFEINYPGGISNKTIQKRIRTTLRDKYGADWKSIVQGIRIAGVRRKYGVSNVSNVPEVLEKRLKTLNEKFGGNSSLCSPEVRAKGRATSRKKYGVDYPNQNPTVYRRAMFKKHPYDLNGTTVYVQGFEPFALDYLIREVGIDPSDISVTPPSFTYKDKGKVRHYHPDILIKSKNLIIEVKSEYTYLKTYRVNKLKKKAVKKSPYKFRFLIMNSDGTRCYDVRGNRRAKSTRLTS